MDGWLREYFKDNFGQEPNIPPEPEPLSLGGKIVLIVLGVIFLMIMGLLFYVHYVD